MKIEDIENTLRLIRERENYLVALGNKEIAKSGFYVGRYAAEIRLCSVFKLSNEEIEYLKQGCIKEIKRLRQTIECLTDE